MAGMAGEGERVSSGPEGWRGNGSRRCDENVAMLNDKRYDGKLEMVNSLRCDENMIQRRENQ